MRKSSAYCCCFGLGLLLLTGCTETTAEPKKDPGSIIGKKTQKIGKFDPKAGKRVSDSKIRATDPITAPLSAYGPMLEKISKSQIEHAVRLFHGFNNRYPKDYDEFMAEIIKKNRIKLPVLPGRMRYEYDEANHKLVIVEEPAPADTTAEK